MRKSATLGLLLSGALIGTVVNSALNVPYAVNLCIYLVAALCCVAVSKFTTW